MIQIERPRPFIYRMAQQRPNAHLFSQLQSPLNRVLEQSTSDALFCPFRMNCKPAQDSDWNRVGHVALDVAWRDFVRHRSCCKRVVANHVVSVITSYEAPGRTVAMVLAGTIEQPPGQLR